MTEVKQGTLLIDQGKVGIVVRIYKIGATSVNDSNAEHFTGRNLITFITQMERMPT